MTATQPEEQQICDETDCVRIYKHLPKKTSPGPDGIPYEAFTYAGKHLIESTQKMFNINWQTEEIPDQWKRSDIKVTYKNKGSKEDLANYRGIFLSSVVCKIFEKLIYKKLESIIDMNMTEFQAGARKGRRTTDHILTLKAKIEYDQYLQKHIKVKGKGQNIALKERTRHRAMERHLSHGITQCYLPPDRDECAPS